jgi:hypothetical protein
MDERGNVIITGRLKDIIVRKGENVSAKELEDLIHLHTSVRDVAVIGLPDADSGERVCAVIQLADGEDDVTLDDGGGEGQVGEPAEEGQQKQTPAVFPEARGPAHQPGRGEHADRPVSHEGDVDALEPEAAKVLQREPGQAPEE